MAPATLRVTVEGEGQVYSPHRLVSCTSRCSYRLRPDRVLTLAVDPARHFSFESWGGTCVGDGPACTVAADAGGTVRAVFRRIDLMETDVFRG